MCLHLCLFSDDIKCICPEGHNYLDQSYKFTNEGEDEILTVNYFCQPVLKFDLFVNLKTLHLYIAAEGV